MTAGQRTDCRFIIHGAAAAATGVGAGLAQLPGADSALLIPIQIGMVVALGKVFGVHITDSAAKGVVLSMAATYGGRLVSQWLVGWIPGIGNAINAGTAAALTEWMGWAVAEKYDQGKLR